MPKEYSDEERSVYQERICHLIANSKVGIRQLCADNPDLPSASTYMKWLGDDADFSERYARAREEQADGLAGEILEISDAPVKVTIPSDADEAEAAAIANAARIELEHRRQRIESRKWVAAKLKPSVYGDKMQLNADVTVNIPDSQIDARLAFLLGKAGVAATVGREGTSERTAQVLLDVPGDGTASA